MQERWLHWVPVLKVKNARESARFYCDVLGFTKEWEHRFADGFPLYIALRHGALALHLSEHDGGGTHRADLFIAVSDVDRTYATLVARGLEAEGPPEDRGYGVRDFGLSDPDGHHLVVGTPLDSFAASSGRTFTEEEAPEE